MVGALIYLECEEGMMCKTQGFLVSLLSKENEHERDESLNVNYIMRSKAKQGSVVYVISMLFKHERRAHW